MFSECGYPQSHESHLDDVRDWLVRGDGNTRVVVLVDWRASQTTMTVRGHLELYRLDKNRIPSLR